MNAVTFTFVTFTPIAALVPGGGAKATDCFAEFSDVAPVVNRRGQITTKTACRDGSACDRDGIADGVCTFGVGVCFNVSGSAACAAAGVETYTALPFGGVVDPQFAALATLANANLPSITAECVGPVSVTVPLRVTPRGLKSAMKVLRTVATHAPPIGRVQTDHDVLILRCDP